MPQGSPRRDCEACGRAFWPRRDYYYLCPACWRPSGSRAEPVDPATAAAALGVDAELVKRAALLTHPDRHDPSRFAEANAVTARLLGVLDTLRRLGRGRAA